MNVAARAYDRLLTHLAARWRRLNRRTVFIGLTGSVGKTTTASCLQEILSARHTVLRQSRNTRRSLAQAVLATRPRHDFAIIETGTVAPGAMRTTAWMLEPNAVAFLNLRPVHMETFSDLAAIQREKAELLLGMARGGLAVLNAGDPLVMSAPRRADIRIATFGRGPESGVWATEVSARWPDRLRLTVHAGDASAAVQTRLVGTQWVTSVLAATATASALGVPLSAIAVAIARVEPYLKRMEPVALPGGAIMIRDDHTGSGPTFEAALAFLEIAQARRRIAVLSEMQNPDIAELEPRLADLGRRTAAVVEGAVFLGPHAGIAAQAAIAAGLPSGAVRSFPSPLDAVPYLRAELREGDLVLLKGQRAPHVGRIYYSLVGEIGCRLATCPRLHFCEPCPELNFVPTRLTGLGVLDTIQSTPRGGAAR